MRNHPIYHTKIIIADFLGERHIGSGWKCDEKMFFVALKRMRESALIWDVY